MDVGCSFEGEFLMDRHGEMTDVKWSNNREL